jgi:hypothetical protein
VIRRALGAIRSFLDAILPSPPSDDTAEAAGRVARLRLRLRLTEKQGHGGNR